MNKKNIDEQTIKKRWNQKNDKNPCEWMENVKSYW